MITKSRKKNNKLVSTPPSPKRLQLFPIKFTYFFQIIDFTILTSVPTEPRADIRLITRFRVSMMPAFDFASASLCKYISPVAERLCHRLSARPLKCHALKRCTSWREACLASVFAYACQSAG